jgi:zinc/manganese transport system substrate-binding protein
MTHGHSWRRTIAMLVIGTLLVACGQGGGTATTSPAPAESPADDTTAATTLNVVATTTIIADMVANVGGDRVNVRSLLPPGADPHTYSPTPGDVQAIAESQIVFENGLGLEEWIDEVISNAGGTRPRVAVTDGLEAIEGDDHHDDEHAEDEYADEHADDEHADDEHADDEHADDEHADDEHADETATPAADDHDDEHADDKHGDDEQGHAHAEDPHMWFDVQRAIGYVENIRDGLKNVDPDGAETYDSSATAYIEQLRQLDREITEQVTQIPEDRRKIVTNHDTFGYFAERYGFEVVGTVFEGVSTEQEPSAQQIAQLVSRIREAGAPAVFTENTVNPRLAEQVANEAGVRVVTDLYTDALGEPGSAGDSYIKMMRHNVQQIVEALR